MTMFVRKNLEETLGDASCRSSMWAKRFMYSAHWSWRWSTKRWHQRYKHRPTFIIVYLGWFLFVSTSNWKRPPGMIQNLCCVDAMFPGQVVGYRATSNAHLPEFHRGRHAQPGDLTKSEQVTLQQSVEHKISKLMLKVPILRSRMDLLQSPAMVSQVPWLTMGEWLYG